MDEASEDEERVYEQLRPVSHHMEEEVNDQMEAGVVDEVDEHATEGGPVSSGSSDGLMEVPRLPPSRDDDDDTPYDELPCSNCKNFRDNALKAFEAAAGMAKLQAVHRNLTAKYDEVRKTNAKASLEVEEAYKKIQDMESKNDTLDADLKVSVSEVQRLRDQNFQYLEVARETGKHQKAADEWRAKYVHSQAILIEKSDNYDALEDKYAKAVDTLTKLNANMKTITSNDNQLRERIKHVNQANKTLKKQRNAAAKIIDDITREYPDALSFEVREKLNAIKQDKLLEFSKSEDVDSDSDSDDEDAEDVLRLMNTEPAAADADADPPGLMMSPPRNIRAARGGRGNRGGRGGRASLRSEGHRGSRNVVDERMHEDLLDRKLHRKQAEYTPAAPSEPAAKSVMGRKTETVREQQEKSKTRSKDVIAGLKKERNATQIQSKNAAAADSASSQESAPRASSVEDDMLMSDDDARSDLSHHEESNVSDKDVHATKAHPPPSFDYDLDMPDFNDFNDEQSASGTREDTSIHDSTPVSQHTDGLLAAAAPPVDPPSALLEPAIPVEQTESIEEPVSTIEVAAPKVDDATPVEPAITVEPVSSLEIPAEGNTPSVKHQLQVEVSMEEEDLSVGDAVEAVATSSAAKTVAVIADADADPPGLMMSPPRNIRAARGGRGNRGGRGGRASLRSEGHRGSRNVVDERMHEDLLDRKLHRKQAEYTPAAPSEPAAKSVMGRKTETVREQQEKSKTRSKDVIAGLKKERNATQIQSKNAASAADSASSQVEAAPRASSVEDDMLMSDDDARSDHGGVDLSHDEESNVSDKDVHATKAHPPPSFDYDLDMPDFNDFNGEQSAGGGREDTSIHDSNPGSQHTDGLLAAAAPPVDPPSALLEPAIPVEPTESIEEPVSAIEVAAPKVDDVEATPVEPAITVEPVAPLEPATSLEIPAEGNTPSVKHQLQVEVSMEEEDLSVGDAVEAVATSSAAKTVAVIAGALTSTLAVPSIKSPSPSKMIQHPKVVKLSQKRDDSDSSRAVSQAEKEQKRQETIRDWGMNLSDSESEDEEEQRKKKKEEEDEEKKRKAREEMEKRKEASLALMKSPPKLSAKSPQKSPLAMETVKPPVEPTRARLPMTRRVVSASTSGPSTARPLPPVAPLESPYFEDILAGARKEATQLKNMPSKRKLPTPIATSTPKFAVCVQVLEEESQQTTKADAGTSRGATAALPQLTLEQKPTRVSKPLPLDCDNELGNLMIDSGPNSPTASHADTVEPTPTDGAMEMQWPVNPPESSSSVRAPAQKPKLTPAIRAPSPPVPADVIAAAEPAPSVVLAQPAAAAAPVRRGAATRGRVPAPTRGHVPVVGGPLRGSAIHDVRRKMQSRTAASTSDAESQDGSSVSSEADVATGSSAATAPAPAVADDAACSSLEAKRRAMIQGVTAASRGVIRGARGGLGRGSGAAGAGVARVAASAGGSRSSAMASTMAKMSKNLQRGVPAMSGTSRAATVSRGGRTDSAGGSIAREVIPPGQQPTGVAAASVTLKAPREKIQKSAPQPQKSAPQPQKSAPQPQKSAPQPQKSAPQPQKRKANAISGHVEVMAIRTPAKTARGPATAAAVPAHSAESRLITAVAAVCRGEETVDKAMQQMEISTMTMKTIVQCICKALNELPQSNTWYAVVSAMKEVDVKEVDGNKVVPKTEKLLFELLTRMHAKEEDRLRGLFDCFYEEYCRTVIGYMKTSNTTADVARNVRCLFFALVLTDRAEDEKVADAQKLFQQILQFKGPQAVLQSLVYLLCQTNTVSLASEILRTELDDDEHGGRLISMHMNNKKDAEVLIWAINRFAYDSCKTLETAAYKTTATLAMVQQWWASDMEYVERARDHPGAVSCNGNAVIRFDKFHKEHIARMALLIAPQFRIEGLDRVAMLAQLDTPAFEAMDRVFAEKAHTVSVFADTSSVSRGHLDRAEASVLVIKLHIAISALTSFYVDRMYGADQREALRMHLAASARAILESSHVNAFEEEDGQSDDANGLGLLIAAIRKWREVMQKLTKRNLMATPPDGSVECGPVKKRRRKERGAEERRQQDEDHGGEDP